jgi:2,3-diketo-5-methylthio-1-phosphopentane phosphatase
VGRKILISDFDGTMTARDFYELVLERMPRGAPAYWRDYAAGRLTHFEAMRSIFAHAPSDPAELERLLDALQPDPHLGESVRILRHAGWEVTVVSAGGSWYIDRILSRAGVHGIPVHANPCRVEPGRGLVLEMPSESPFLSAETGIDKPGVVRDALARFERVAFAGDGPPDLPPALLVAPELRFARGWLADALNRRGERYREFAHWRDIAAALSSL